MTIVAQTKTELIYDDLKKKILSCELPPDTRLVIRKLSTEYGSSDIPVREALKELTAEGLLETTPHVGSKVIGVSVENVRDMVQMREFLEPLAARLAAKNSNPEIVAALKQAYAHSKEMAETGDATAYSNANRAFHAIIMKACNNIYLQKMLEDLLEIDKRTRMIFQINSQIIPKSMAEHREMIKLMEAKDGEGMAKLTKLHKGRALKRMKEYFNLK